MSLELGLDTFGDIANGPDGVPLHPATVIREVLAEGELADRLGLDFFGIGEHHRPDYAVSAPAIVLGAAAELPRAIRINAVSPSALEDAPSYHSSFPGFVPVSSYRVGMAYAKSVLGVQTGQIFPVD